VSDLTREGWRNFYGRRFGKTLRDSQRTFLSEDLETLRPQGVALAENPDRLPVDPCAIFGDARPVWLEVGFGGGEHMVHMAAAYPEVGVIGCEPFVNGVAMLLGKIRAAGVTNLAVYPGDARDVLDVLPKGSVARAFLNYPAPWPKRRHHRRRFVTPEHLGPLARVLASPGPSSGWRPTFPTMCVRRWSRCRRPGSGWKPRAGCPGTTGCRPAMSRRRCARGACRIT